VLVTSRPRRGRREPRDLTDGELAGWVYRQARCAGSPVDPDDWFPVTHDVAKARDQAAQAIAVCARCPVRPDCLELSLRHACGIGAHGVWGGLVEEVQGLIARGVPPDAKPLGAIGYRHVLANLNKACAWDDTIRMIQRDTRRYAKRQLTWFRRQAQTAWFGGPGDNKAIEEEVHRKVTLFLGEFYGV